MKLRLRLSLHDAEHPEKYLGGQDKWEMAETMLRDVAKSNNTPYEEAAGEAAFYGPKLDFMATDSLGRQWQVATIQLDMNMPERFDLSCTNEDGQPERIVMIHAAIMGSIERFLSIIIEHFAGDFPLWLAPVQVAILPISEKFIGYALKVQDELKAQGIRVSLDSSAESIGKKIRNAETQHYPIMLVLGEKEEQARTVAVRTRRKGDEKTGEGSMTVDDLLNQFNFNLPGQG